MKPKLAATSASPSPKRKSYTAAFKLEVVKYAIENSNRAAGRHFSVDEKQIRDWKKKQDILRQCKKSKKANRGKVAKNPDLENKLMDWIVEQRGSARAVNTIQIRIKAKQLAAEMKIKDFVDDSSWCYRFMKRKNICIRQRTTMCQQLPVDYEEKIRSFREFIELKRGEYDIQDTHIVNMDEVPLTFDIPMTRTAEQKGIKSVNIRTTGHEKAHFTAVLAVTAAGNKLPPMLIFKRKTAPKEKFPKGIVIENNPKGWMDQEMMGKWITKCFKKRPDGFFHTKKAMLVMDSMRAHIAPDILPQLSAVNTIPAVIPGGLTKLLQPLDISVNRVFKGELRLTWESWMSEGEHSFTKTGRMRRASLTEVANWVLGAWGKVKITTIINGFRKAEIIPAPPLDTDNEQCEDTQDSEDEPMSTEPTPSCSTSDEPGTSSGSHLDVVSGAGLDPAIAQLFHSDSEESDFDGFESDDMPLSMF